MRFVNGFLCLLFLFFAGVQYNDPDGWLWAIAQLSAAGRAGPAAVRPATLQGAAARTALGPGLAAAVVGTRSARPPVAGWWHRVVWWHSELAREGMGVMLIVLGLIVVAFTAWRGRSSYRSQDPVRGT